MSTTPESSPGSTEKPLPKVPVETDRERAIRHAEIRLADWNRLQGCDGVREAFAGATLKDYPEEDATRWRTTICSKGWIFTQGPVGTGKTHMLSALVRSRFIWGWACWFVYVPEFLGRLKRSFDRSAEELPADLLWRAENCDLLAFDDIGTEKLTDWTFETLTSIVNTRYSRKLATIISSNFTIDELAKRYKRLADRIRERALVVPLEERRPERG